MPIRSANLATMSATIAGAKAGTRGGPGRAVVVFESGHRQEVEGGGCRRLDAEQGGVVSVETEKATRFALFKGTSCQGGKADATGTGPVTFGVPVLAGAIVLG
ncbi:phosphatase [Nocardiopsis suaedae]|uniref:Phosphatase n=1 Tax=Nocardiopsis suaedae TaxID=3018444 RepID=A0ABT4TN88_9ACTN|nr:phosphatase [Nocardiopsis suaedae]MDA2805572.1 phosphatase [Nocardiopsis suaedae]